MMLLGQIPFLTNACFIVQGLLPQLVPQLAEG